MEETAKYKCSKCGQEHDSWPALTFNSPIPYYILSENDRANIAELDSDFCVINHFDRTDRFVRCSLKQKVTDHCEALEYGLWVSLSEKSFQDYADNFDNKFHEAGYFGWLSNNLPDYEFDKPVPMNVYAKSGNQRPEIEPHDDFDHPFVYDYYNGITKSEAENRINDMLGKM